MISLVDLHKKDGQTPHFNVYIGRKVRWVDWTFNSKWGNYYQTLEEYEVETLKHFKKNLVELKNNILGCWCITTDKIEPLICHGQILMKLVREYEEE